ncbi:HAMP domain-containing protein [bacterium]|nr:HAMP domain-containing protein [bacterium]
MRVSRVGLRVRIIAFMIAISAFLLVALGTVWLRLAERNFIQMKVHAGAVILSALQSVIQLEWEGRYVLVMGHSDQARLQEIIDAFGNNLQVPNLFIVAKDGQILAHRRFEQVGKRYMDTEIEDALSTLRLVKRYEAAGARGIQPDDALEVTGPLFLGSQVVGAIRFRLAMDDAAQSLAATRRLLAWYLVFTVAATSLAGLTFLVRLIVRPLDELERVTTMMTEGDLDHRVPVRSRDEIGRLAAALDNLQRTLRDGRAALSRKSDHLRTAEEKLEKAREEIIRQDRLAYLGRVAAGVAHEVGNPLGAIYNYLGILESADDAESREIAARMQREVERIDRIMRELLDFSRPRAGRVAPVNVPEYLEECVNMLRDQRQLDGMETHVRAPDELPPLLIDPGELKQVVVNALTNARDAAGGDGTIDLTVEAFAYSETAMLESRLEGATSMPTEPERVAYTDLARRGIAFSSRPAFEPGMHVLAIHVRDSGPGLSPEAVQRVFEPFYTTKTPGKGTGLGLPICQRIVEGAGGVLRFESKRARDGRSGGTVVSIYIPAPESEKERRRDELLAQVEGA